MGKTPESEQKNGSGYTQQKSVMGFGCVVIAQQ